MVILNEGKKYLRQKDLAGRYNVSEATISGMIKRGDFPPPLIWNNIRLWPIELINRIDEETNNRYEKTLDEKWQKNDG